MLVGYDDWAWDRGWNKTIAYLCHIPSVVRFYLSLDVDGANRRDSVALVRLRRWEFVGRIDGLDVTHARGNWLPCGFHPWRETKRGTSRKKGKTTR